MNGAIRSLKQRLQYKERELAMAKNVMMREEDNYRMVKYDFRLSWYGKREYQHAKNNYDWIKREIDYLKQKIARMEEKEKENENENEAASVE